MPSVGGKKFSYNAAGRRAAKKHARKTGQPMKKIGSYGQGMDRRGGARTGLLGRTSRPFGMKKKSPLSSSKRRPSKGMARRPMRRSSY